MNNVPIVYTVKEVSQILKCNKNYVYDLINGGLLPALKLGSLKIREEALHDFLSEYENWDLTDVDNIVKIETDKPVA